MGKEKEISLNEALDKIYAIGFGLIPDDSIEEYFAEKLVVFGTTVDEKYTTLDGMRKLIRNQKEQSAGLDIKFERKELFRDLLANETVASIADEVVIKITINADSLQFYIRCSIIMEYKNKQWKLNHWHASKPELVQSEEDTFGIEDWKQKTDALEKMVAERTADLVIKNRELEIEGALDKVRARTIAMQHSNELAEASFLLDSQIRALGIQTRGCAFNIYGENESTEWFSSATGTMPTYKTPRADCFLRYYEARKTGEKILIEDFGGQACADHYAYLCTIPVMGDALKEMIRNGGSFPERQIDHIVYFKYGYLLFITLEPAPEAHEIFIRFANIFEQTYTRFLDLQKAEAQALQAAHDLVEIKEARLKAEAALTELQAAQKQLIQSEKMASLGELTAGIAHEIQNPLNFVNNFSEISSELIEEVKSQKSKLKSEELDQILDDIDANIRKILHHGKRADGIVKGMLQHSQTSKGQKIPTDINALADEYLRLAYHGLRAKDKNFNATLQTDFDSSIVNINAIPQDIGRVLLNLITNALYVVEEKRKSGAQNYNPTVSVSTRRINDTVQIEVSDNGNGVPKTIIDKIFQPFFTTKPTGQGTGLGLSLSYDIVKAHGGEFKVKTEEGHGSTFIIQIPVN